MSKYFHTESNSLPASHAVESDSAVDGELSSSAGSFALRRAHYLHKTGNAAMTAASSLPQSGRIPIERRVLNRTLTGRSS